jgi:signal transduction histidine kinase
VRELARAHGGELTYEPADPGARFVLTLPDRPGP